MIDLGLRLPDIGKHGLEREAIYYRESPSFRMAQPRRRSSSAHPPRRDGMILPFDLRDRVTRQLQANPSLSWGNAVAHIAQSKSDFE